MGRVRKITRAAPAVALAVCLAAFGVLALRLYAVSPCLFQCDIIAPWFEPPGILDKFRSCSDVPATIIQERSTNVAVRPSGVEGWELLTPQDPSRSADILVRLKKDRDSFVFFPRLQGINSRITVYALDDPGRRILFLLRGSEDSWTPVSRQYPLDLRCVRYGDRNDVETLLLVRLQGPATQIWQKDGHIFF